MKKIFEKIKNILNNSMVMWYAIIGVWGVILVLMVIMWASPKTFGLGQQSQVTISTNVQISQSTLYNTIAFYDADASKWKIINNVGSGSEIKAWTFLHGGGGIAYLATNPMRIERIDLNGNKLSTNAYPGDINKVVGFNQGTGWGVTAIQEDGMWYSVSSSSSGTWTARVPTDGKIPCSGKVVNAGGQGDYEEMIVLCDDGTMAVGKKSGGMGASFSWANEGDLYTDEATYGNITGMDILAATNGPARSITTDKGNILMRYESWPKFKPYPGYPDPIVNGYIYPNSFVHSSNGWDFAYAEDTTLAKSHFYHFESGTGTNVGNIPGCKMKLGISYYSSAPKWQFAALVSDACTNPDKRAVCGDRTVDAGMGETCDDGNTVSGDGCSSTCQSEAPPPTGGGGAVTASPSVHVSVVGPDQQTATVSKVGDQATITLTVTNPTGASVPIKYTMPSGFKFDNVISGGTCTASGSDVTCTAVQPGTSMIKIKAEVTSL